MKNLVKFLTIGLLSLSLIASCSKDPLTNPTNPANGQYPRIYVRAFGPEEYTGYIKGGDFCGEVVSSKRIPGPDYTTYEIRVSSDYYNDYAPGYGDYITQWFKITYLTSDIKSNHPVGSRFCVDRPW